MRTNQGLKKVFYSDYSRGINQAFGIGTTTERTAQWWFKKFRVNDENLENTVINVVVGHRILTTIN